MKLLDQKVGIFLGLFVLLNSPEMDELACFLYYNLFSYTLTNRKESLFSFHFGRIKLMYKYI